MPISVKEARKKSAPLKGWHGVSHGSGKKGVTTDDISTGSPADPVVTVIKGAFLGICLRWDERRGWRRRRRDFRGLRRHEPFPLRGEMRKRSIIRKFGETGALLPDRWNGGFLLKGDQRTRSFFFEKRERERELMEIMVVDVT